MLRRCSWRFQWGNQDWVLSGSSDPLVHTRTHWLQINRAILASRLCVTSKRTFLCTRKLVCCRRGWCSAVVQWAFKHKRTTNQYPRNWKQNHDKGHPNTTILVQPSWCKAMMVSWNTHTHNREWVYVPSHAERFKILFCVKFSQVSTCVRYQERNRQRGSTCTQAAFSSENESLHLHISLRGLKKMKKLF